ncbi:MAG: alpha/beta hydrolase [Melioribacteraceae bacterium]|nr:alpha/beta hydrolase [Melioribacteraceae bacterium]
MEYSVNGLKVFTRGNKSNKAIVFIHGFPYDHQMWEYQVDYFKEDYYCVTYDIRGLGESYIGDGQYTMEAFVWDLLSIIDTLHIEDPILCALSMGGYIALRAIEKEHDRFSGLILCDSRAEADDNNGKLKRSNAIDKINVEGVEAFTNDFVPTCFHKKTPERLSEMYEKQMGITGSQNSIGVKGSLLAMLSRNDVTKALKKFDLPVLLFVGIKDQITPPERMKKIADRIKKSKYYVVPKSGHMAPLENPDFVNKKISKFLRDNF